MCVFARISSNKYLDHCLRGQHGNGSISSAFILTMTSSLRYNNVIFRYKPGDEVLDCVFSFDAFEVSFSMNNIYHIFHIVGVPVGPMTNRPSHAEPEHAAVYRIACCQLLRGTAGDDDDAHVTWGDLQNDHVVFVLVDHVILGDVVDLEDEILDFDDGFHILG